MNINSLTTATLVIIIVGLSVFITSCSPSSKNEMQIERLTTKVNELEQRVSREEDVTVIMKLKQRYVSLADQKYLHGKANSPEIVKAAAKEFSELFVEDGTWGGGGAGAILKGRDEIYERLAGIHQPWFQHYMMSPELKIEGDIAYGRWYVLNLTIDTKGRAMVISGYEDDVYVKIDGKWLFKDMLWNDVMSAPINEGWSHPESFPKSGNPWENMPFK